MTKDNLLVLFDYHYWARDRVLDAVDALTSEQLLRETGGSFRSVRDTLVHVHSAEWAWYSRWTGEAPAGHLSPDSFPDVPAIRKASMEQERRIRTLLENTDGTALAREPDYTTFQGARGRSVFWHMAQHVVNHATYHRGQIVTLLRQMGATPPKSTDLIAFYRARQGR